MNGQRAFFDSRAEGWEERCYPPDVRVRLEELVREFGVTPGSFFSLSHVNLFEYLLVGVGSKKS